MKEPDVKNYCLLPASDELRRGMDEFNAGAWFECHETLEELWSGEKDEARNFFQGILQVAVGLYHWRNGNYRGAVRLLETGTHLLHRVSPVCMEVDVAALLRDAGRFRERLVELGPEKMAQIERELVPRIRMAESGGEKTK